MHVHCQGRCKLDAMCARAPDTSFFEKHSKGPAKEPQPRPTVCTHRITFGSWILRSQGDIQSLATEAWDVHPTNPWSTKLGFDKQRNSPEIDDFLRGATQCPQRSGQAVARLARGRHCRCHGGCDGRALSSSRREGESVRGELGARGKTRARFQIRFGVSLHFPVSTNGFHFTLHFEPMALQW